MAQVIWQEIGGDVWKAESAGSDPAGYVHPLALTALAEIELPIDGLVSKSMDEFKDQQIDLVVTVCDNAKESCPMIPMALETQHWPFDDPAHATGTDEEKMAVFRRVREEIKASIKSYFG